MDDLSYGNIWKSLALVMPITAVGLFLLRDDAQAKGFLGLAAIVCGVLVLHVLDRRELREKNED